MITAITFLRAKGILGPGEDTIIVTNPYKKQDLDLVKLLEEYHKIRSEQEKGIKNHNENSDTIQT